MTIPTLRIPNWLSEHAVYFAYLAIAFIIWGGLQVIYWTFFPVIVFDYNRPIQLTEKTVEGDSYAEYIMDYCKGPLARNLVADVHYSLTDGLIYNLADTYAEILDYGCHVKIEGLRIPDVTPGWYQLIVTRVYRINPIRTVVVSSTSPPFQLTAKHHN